MMYCKGFLTSFLAIALVASGNAANAAILQWGFDYTSGAVTSQNGGVIVNDGTGGSGFDGSESIADTFYSSDIPTVNVQNATGIGSVDVSGLFDGEGALRTSGFAGVLMGGTAGIVSAGGITIEAWAKRMGAGAVNPLEERIISMGGYFNLDIRETADNTGLIIRSLSNTSGIVHPSFTVPAEDVGNFNDTWVHYAATYEVGPDAADDVHSLYINGVLVSQASGLNNVPNMSAAAAQTRAIAFGNGFASTNRGFQGLIYEPRISLGVLDPSEFTIRTVPEPTTTLLLCTFAVGLAITRRSAKP